MNDQIINKKKEINNELKRRISICLNKNYGDTISEEDLKKVENIRFDFKLINGERTNINIEDAKLFPNLKNLTLGNYQITQKDFEILSTMPNIESISFCECSFDDIEFKEISNLPSNLIFSHCRQMPKKLPQLKRINVNYCDIDFSSIDLSEAEKIYILNSKISNIRDVEEFDNITELNLDGSELLTHNGVLLSDIKVGKNCIYSHKERDLHPVDNRKEDYDFENR